MTRRPGEYADADKLAQEMLEQETKRDPTEDTAAPVATTKVPTWEDRLQEAKLTPEQGLEILDSMIEKGYYEKSFPLYGGRRHLVLRTRDAYCRQRVALALDALRTNDARVHTQTTLRVCLAGSIAQFGKKILAFAPPDADLDVQEKAFNDRLRYIDSIPEPFLDILYETLSQFDIWTYAALSNGAPSGF